jgi:hypothetical protein
MVLLGVVYTPAWSQDPPVQEKKAPELVQWAIAPDVVHKNIHFILDRSGSMSADQLASAMGCFLMVAAQPTDEVNIAITVFGENAVRWEGAPDERTPRGWASMPSQENLDAAKQWISTVELNSSSTKVEEALRTVDTKVIERPGDDIDEITVIIISDLIFDNYPESLLNAVSGLRNARVDNHAKDFNLGFVGIKTSVGRLTELRDLSRRRGFWLAYIGDHGPREEGEEEGEELPNEPLPDPNPLPLPGPPSPH